MLRIPLRNTERWSDVVINLFTDDVQSHVDIPVVGRYLSVWHHILSQRGVCSGGVVLVRSKAVRENNNRRD